MEGMHLNFLMIFSSSLGEDGGCEKSYRNSMVSSNLLESKYYFCVIDCDYDFRNQGLIAGWNIWQGQEIWESSNAHFTKLTRLLAANSP